jgi:hypothetical protein
MPATNERDWISDCCPDYLQFSNILEVMKDLEISKFWLSRCVTCTCEGGPKKDRCQDWFRFESDVRFAVTYYYVW